MKTEPLYTGPAAGDESPEPGQRLEVAIRLRAEDHAAQPLFANFTGVQGAPGMVFIDFGFLEPRVLPSVLRRAQGAGQVPEAVNGRLAARVVLGMDAAVQLAQQLQGHLRSLQAPSARVVPSDVAPS